MSTDDSNPIKPPKAGHLREVRYDLTALMAELPGDRLVLKLDKELVAQDDITKVFKLKKRNVGKESKPPVS